jgi:hypothetical protein
MEEIGPFCKNCGHSFDWHEQSFDDFWFCDFEDDFEEYCTCNHFEQKRAAGTKEDPVEVPYDSESYKWN